MAKTSFSIVPDSLINVGTAFGILLGLAVGLMSGLMITPERTTTTATTVTTKANNEERTIASLRKLFVERASVQSSSMRLIANGQPSSVVAQLLKNNSKALTTGLTSIATPVSAQRLTAALDQQSQLAENLALQTAQQNTANISAARQQLETSRTALQETLLAVSSGAAKDVQSLVQRHTANLIALATNIQQPQSYQNEAALAVSYDDLVTYLRDFPR